MVLMMMLTMMFINITKSELHYVGGDKFSWVPKVNLTEWSSHEHFHLNDWLYFGYDRDMYNVLEVNETSYANCITTGFIKNVSTGAGRDVFQLTEFKTFYFLSGGGYCSDGMKVAIKVTEGVAAPTPAPSPKSAAPAPSPESAAPAPSPEKGDACGIHLNQILLVFIFVFMWGISSNYISY
uniref:Lamin-like protein n=2 Tax=Cajanus cajan TaxID=3821 RepID=A0A151U1L5_CAJCA|nr:Lamin-like protein [Cajanus cajan]